MHERQKLQKMKVTPTKRTLAGSPTRGTSGETLRAETAKLAEQRFGFDFSRVRVHADSTAATAAAELGARAFTSQWDVYFGRHQYQPETPQGEALLEHELRHVLTQMSKNASADEHWSELDDPHLTDHCVAVQLADNGRSLTEYTRKDKESVWKYGDSVNTTRWMEAKQIDFLKGAGFDIFNAAKTKGFSTFGALFIVAQASLESGWGKGNWAAATKN